MKILQKIKAISLAMTMVYLTVPMSSFAIADYSTLDSVGSAYFADGIQANDGLIYMSPISFTGAIGIYNPVANNFYSGTSHGEGSVAFHGTVQADNGDIIFAPSSSSHIGIYDPITDSYTSGPSASGFHGAVKTDNGDVIFVPYSKNRVGIYNPDTNTYTDGAITGENNFSFHNGVKLPNGNIVMIPSDSEHIGIYDPSTDTYTSGPSIGVSTGGSFHDGALIGNGSVILAPLNHGFIGIYDPSTNTYTDGPSVLGNKYTGVVEGNDGVIYLIPDGANAKIGMYHPSTNTFEEHPYATTSPDGGYHGLVKLSSGKIVLIPGPAKELGLLSWSPDTPTTTYPAQNATELSLTPTLAIGGYNDTDNDDFANSEWRITTTPGDYTNPTYSTGATPDNEASLDIPPSTLKNATKYYWQVRHQDASGAWSEWSVESAFTTISNPEAIAQENDNTSQHLAKTGIETPASTFFGISALLFGIVSVRLFQEKIRYKIRQK